MGSLDPDPDPNSQSGSESKRKKMSEKNRKKYIIFEVLDVFLRAESFSCSLNILYEGLGISKFLILIKKR
jgi:hypothetical protein